MKKVIIFALVFGFITINVVQAQHRYENPRSMGMGATGTTFIGDFNANFINPANLMLSDRRNGVVISFGEFALGGGGPLADINTYNTYLTEGRLLDRVTQREMLDLWVGAGSDSGKLHYAGANVNVVPMAFSARLNNQAFSGAFRVRAMGNMGVSRGLLEAGFGGLDSELFGDSRDMNLDSSFQSFAEVSFGYARTVYQSERGPILELPIKIYAGIAPKILMGITANEFSVNSTMRVSGDSLVVHNFEYSIKTFGELTGQFSRYLNDRNTMDTMPDLSDYLEAPSDLAGFNGSGFGLDFGLTAEIDLPPNTFKGSFIGAGRQFFRMSMSVTDMGSLSFKNDAATFRNEDVLEWRGASIDQDRLQNEFNSNLGDYFDFVLSDSIGTDIYLNFSKIDESAIKSTLPTMFNFGFELTAGKLTAVMDISRGLNESGVNSKATALGMGFEYRAFNFMPLRAGFNTGGMNSASWTVGTGLMTRNYDLNVGLMFVGNSQSSGTWVALGLSAFTFRF